MAKKLKQILLQGEEGLNEGSILGSLVGATNNETFESHATNETRHVPAAAEDGKLLYSKNGAAPEWAGPESIFANAALTGTPTAPTAATGTDSEQIATAAFVQAAVTALHQTIAKEMTSGFKMAGNLGDGEGDIAALPTEGYVVGETYYVAKAGTYAGQTCEVGDMISCRATNGVDADWFVIQKNLINAIVGPATSVDGNLMAFNGVNGDTAKDSGLSMTDVSTAVNVGKALDAGKETLAKYGADANDNPTYNGKSIGTLQVVSSVEEATAANAPVGTVFFVVEEAAA